MNPVYSPVQPGAPYGNPKNMAYTGYPAGYPTAAPTYNPNMYPTTSPGYAPATLLMKQAWPQTSTSCATEGTFHLPVDTGTENRTYQASAAAFRYTAGTPYKVPPTQSNSAPPPYSPSPNPYQTAMYPIRSAYPQQNLYAQGAYYTQPVYAAQPHVIHHTTVVQPNSIPSAIYPAPVAAPRTNGVAMGMVAGTTMAMSAAPAPPPPPPVKVYLFGYNSGATLHMVGGKGSDILHGLFQQGCPGISSVPCCILGRNSPSWTLEGKTSRPPAPQEETFVSHRPVAASAVSLPHPPPGAWSTGVQTLARDSC
ncbi:protein FAM168A isoform X2 [Zootoca vivipara]|uniref:protein FAM168A isoform X2 n=1 Tax=Zootoca vivipara TaxID=8524 RepID=UPI00293BD4D6|nr:protein FAM168A isoform X2 [Zootoca vivipara]